MTSTAASRPGVSYLAIMALLTSIGALTTDIMLPALGVIGRDLDVGNINDTTLIVTAFFLGMAIGQLVVGPLADSYGRKRVVHRPVRGQLVKLRRLPVEREFSAPMGRLNSSTLARRSFKTMLCSPTMVVRCQ